MANVNETIVREYFELHGFFVNQQRKHLSNVRRDDEEIDFLLVNPHFEGAGRNLPFELSTPHLKHIAKAVVACKGWYSEIFSPSFLVANPDVYRFVEPAALKHAEANFKGGGALTKILVVPALPATEELRVASIEFLSSRGVDGVISFRTMLADLIDNVVPNRHYARSDLLQILRILKNFEFFREPQLELFGRKRRRPKKGPAKAGSAGS